MVLVDDAALRVPLGAAPPPAARREFGAPMKYS